MTETYKFKACYITDITHKIGRIEESFDKWQIPYEKDSEGNLQLEAPWEFIKGDTPEGKRKAVLQMVVCEKESENPADLGFAFRPDVSVTVIMKARGLSEEFSKFLFDEHSGYNKIYPVAYTWNASEDEPVVI